jgi:PIN domain nuclease of toxin-antitoxin system
MGTSAYLIDSHVILWAVFEPSKLSRKARNIVRGIHNPLVVSAVSAYELGNKFRLGKLPGLDSLFVGYHRHILELTPNHLAVTAEHALAAGTLGWEHRDPFDRLLAAQAMIEGYTLITADNVFDTLPGLETLW